MKAKNSHVPDGYKVSEVGVIPEDWEVSKLELITDPRRPISYGIVQTGQSVLNGIKCIRVIDINNGKINQSDLITTSEYISDAYSRTILKAGDIVMPLRGKVGDAAIIDKNLVGCNLTRGVALIALQSEYHPHYCKFYISSPANRTRLEQSMNGSALQEIPIATLRNYKIPLPPLAEQTAIATALSDADALIESLEKLIAKKRLLKQGAMQELLKPKEGWIITNLGVLGTFFKGSGVTKDQSLSGNLPCVRYGEIYTKHNDVIKYFYSYISKDVSKTAIRLKSGDLLFAGSGETKEEIGKCVAFIDEIEAYAGGDIVILRSEKANSIFLGYYLNSRSIVQQKASKGQGDAVVHITGGALADIEITIPQYAEQLAIASALSDMDGEISALEAKLEKARQIKQGMMNNLLTGKIRLMAHT